MYACIWIICKIYLLQNERQSLLSFVYQDSLANPVTHINIIIITLYVATCEQYKIKPTVQDKTVSRMVMVTEDKTPS